MRASAISEVSKACKFFNSKRKLSEGLIRDTSKILSLSWPVCRELRFLKAWNLWQGVFRYLFTFLIEFPRISTQKKKWYYVKNEELHGVELHFGGEKFQNAKKQEIKEMQKYIGVWKRSLIDRRYSAYTI